jgi:hypothetical protein
MFEADVFLVFLKRLVRHNKKKVFLIIDKHPVHRSSKVTKWLKEERNNKRIAIFFMPGYLWKRQRRPSIVKNYFQKSNVHYAAL